MEILFYLYWFGVAIACALLARNKGRGAFGWFVLGALFNLIALLWLLFVRTDNETLEARAIERGDAKKCPFCAELIKPDAMKCMHCGSILMPMTTGDPVPPQGRHIQFR